MAAFESFTMVVILALGSRWETANYFLNMRPLCGNEQ
jgi:hypothetical protein